MGRIKVVVVGSGNLAWHLVSLFQNYGNPQLVQIYSRKALPEVFRAFPFLPDHSTSIDYLVPDADLYLLAVSDHAIPSVSKQLATVIHPGAIVAHLSGSLPPNALDESLQYRVVWYPLQSFTAGRPVNWSEIPCFICGSKRLPLDVLRKFNKQLGLNSIEISAQDKLHLHLAAVIVNNFVNHLLTLSHDYLKEHQINPDYVKPLMLETFQKALELTPENAQTGPARRMYKNVIDRHLQLLENDKPTALLYKLLSEAIFHRHNKP